MLTAVTAMPAKAVGMMTVMAAMKVSIETLV